MNFFKGKKGNIMKKISLILIALFFVISNFNIVESKAVETQELGKRYIKLGNSYREGGEFDKAIDYLSQGIRLVKKSKDKYWTAVGYEYMGYYYEDTNKQGKAKQYFKKALGIYEDIITQLDGSPIAIAHLLRRIGGGNARISNTIVNLDNQKLKIIPPNLSRGITNLSLRDNKIKDISGLIMYKNLKYLDLSGNKIKSIPGTISSLSKLKYLDLSGNKIKEIPIEALCKLTGLKMLNLSGNKIPFEQIANLIRCLPNTNIQHDKYEMKKKAVTGLQGR